MKTQDVVSTLERLKALNDIVIVLTDVPLPPYIDMKACIHEVASQVDILIDCLHTDITLVVTD